MLTSCRSAHNEVLLALDFVSLLLSKDAPKNGEATMSPALKQLIKPGTLGTDVWQGTNPLAHEKKQTDDTISKGWRMQFLQNSADSLLRAASRLQDNVKRETQYWEQVLSLSEKGWSVCRMRGERHNLGVRYGFSEAYGEFRERGLAALRSDDDGNIVLDKGLGHDPKALRVHLQEGSRVTGVSKIPALANGSETTLESRIRHARDSLYEEELFHEVVRESRTLASYGVFMDSSTIRFPTRLRSLEDDSIPGQHVVVELVSLNEVDEVETDHESDRYAQAISLAFRLLLSHTHRERLAQRSQLPVPMSAAKREAPVAPILRPVMTILQHKFVLDVSNAYLERVTSLLTAASVRCSTSRASFELGAVDRSGSADALVSSLVAPFSSTASLSVFTPRLNQALEFHIKIYTSIAAPVFGSRMTVISPISPHTADFTEVQDMVDHLDASVSGALARDAARLFAGWTINERDAEIEKPEPLRGKTDKVKIILHSGLGRSEKAEQGRLTLDTGKHDGEQWSSGRQTGGHAFWEVMEELMGG